MLYFVRCLIPSLMLAWVLAGCGYRGDLYLPDDNPTQKEAPSSQSSPAG